MSEYEYQECPESGVRLTMRALLGRNAYHKRNNIFVDLKDNIISFSGCNLLVMQQADSDSSGFRQSLLKPDVIPVSNHPEISCMALGDCKRLLVVGSSEETAKLMGWDISINSPLFQIALPGFVSVQLLKISPCRRKAGAIAISRSAHKSLLLINLERREV